MQKVLSAFNNFCFFHMDDILVHDSNEVNCLEHLKIILERSERQTWNLNFQSVITSKGISNI